MKPHPTITGTRHAIQLGDIFYSVEDRSEIVGKHSLAGKGKEVGHYKDASLNASIPESHAFLGVADSQPFRTMSFQGARDLHCAMPISVGFDYRHDLDIRTDDVTYGF
jgi:hypothetical protein